MTVLSVIKDVCAAVGVLQPQSVFSGITGNRTMQEMVALANEMAQRIAYDTRDWQALQSSTAFIGDGVADSFPVPQNFKRMMLTGNVYRGTYTSPMRFVGSIDQWVRSARSNQWSTALGG